MLDGVDAKVVSVYLAHITWSFGYFVEIINMSVACACVCVCKRVFVFNIKANMY